MGGRRTAAHSFRALGTTAVVVAGEPGALDEAVRVTRRELQAIDRACSRFRDDSDLSRANAAAGTDVSVGPLLVEAVGVALRAAETTGGDVDPTLGAAMSGLGYDRDFALIARDAGARALRVREVRDGAWRHVVLDRRRGTVRVPRGSALDLGATAKALAADRAASAVHAATGAAALVSLGGDLSIAGTRDGAGWAVGIAEDHAGEGPPDEVVDLREGGLATSGTTVRRWGPGRAAHHILDPRTGRPCACAWRTVSVAAPTCVEANVASTGAIVRGRSAPGWLAARGLPARLVSDRGEVVRVAGWPEPRT